jgi:hypothetical protein
MCANTVQIARVRGSAKGRQGWFAVSQARAVYDHPFHADMEEALIIDFADPAAAPGARVSVELSAESAASLLRLIEAALPKGGHRHQEGDAV